MALALHLSYETIQTHFKDIRKVLHVSTTIEVLQKVSFGKGDINNIVLTPRGIEIFNLLRQGLTIEETACSLGISRSTINRHRENMLLINECKTILELASKYYGTHTTQKSTDTTSQNLVGLKTVEK